MRISTKAKAMVNLVGMVQDYKNNIPLKMLENKYKVPIHTIINVLYAVTVEKKEVKNV